MVLFELADMLGQPKSCRHMQQVHDLVSALTRNERVIWKMLLPLALLPIILTYVFIEYV